MAGVMLSRHPPLPQSLWYFSADRGQQTPILEGTSEPWRIASTKRVSMLWSSGVTNMRQAAPSLRSDVSWQAVQGSLWDPLSTSRSMRDSGEPPLLTRETYLTSDSLHRGRFSNWASHSGWVCLSYW